LYAYPLVLMDITRKVATNVAEPDSAAQRAPVNQFVHWTTLADADFRDVVRANADTLYSLMWYDVRQEPIIVSMPDTAGRYFVMPLMDMWTDVYASLGTRTTAGSTAPFAITAPGWDGALPAGVRKIVSPTPAGWLVGRVQVDGPDDLPAVYALQQQIHATPLSSHGRPSTPPAGTVDPSIDMTTPPVEQVKKLAPADFFRMFAELLRDHSPHAADYSILLRMERIGLIAGRPFELGSADQAIQRGLTRAADDVYDVMMTRGRAMRARSGCWSIARAMVGTYGADYLSRAFTAYRGLGALPPEEAIYPSAMTDDAGDPLTGARRYTLHFDAGQTPPADAFWSLTMYGADQFMVHNPIGRYAIGDRDDLDYNADGSLDICIQHESPGALRERNWLPCPSAAFDVTLRIYLPRAEAVDGRWPLPSLRPAE